MNENPVFSIAGAMPGGSETSWQTAYPNPDAHFGRRPATPSAPRGPSFSIAGAMPGGSTILWDTAYPTGESIYVDALRRAEARAALDARAAAIKSNVVALHRPTRRPPVHHHPKAA